MLTSSATEADFGTGFLLHCLLWDKLYEDEVHLTLQKLDEYSFSRNHGSGKLLYLKGNDPIGGTHF